MKVSLRLSSTRLAALYVVIFAVGISALLSAVSVLTARVIDREVDAVIQAEVNGLIDVYRQGGLLQLIATLNRRADSWGRSGAVYLLADHNGNIMAGNLVRWPTRVEINQQWLEFYIDASEQGGIVAHPVRAQVFRLPGDRVLLVGTDILERRRVTSRLRSAMLWGVGLCILLAALIGYGYSRGVRRRIVNVASTCETIMAGDLSRRLPVESTHDEFDELSATVNGMLDRIEHQTTVLRTTFDSAAHDLRAPLYRARVRIEETLQHMETASAARETMEATLAELDRVQRTLGTLLQIAEAEGRGRDFAPENIDLGALTREIVELYRPEAGARRIALEYSGASDEMRVRGNRQLLAQAIVNLIENALKNVPPDGAVNVSVAREQSGVLLTVSDNGPGIPSEHRERVLRPFVRLERDRDQHGSGLGLSLVAAVMRLHGASMEMRDNEPGLAVRCKFP
jgi:signal transduction histidine kinase